MHKRNSEPEQRLRRGDCLDDRYRLDRVLGVGGMGKVWVSRDLRLNRDVAVKTTRAIDDSTLQQRFRNEAMAVAQLRSPHVVQLYDYGVYNGMPYMVMELLDGCSLSRRLHDRKRLAPEIVVPLIHQVALGLSTAHKAGIIHRDLKPANIFLVSYHGSEVAKVLDFGISKIQQTKGSTTLTEVGVLLGTPHYMAPEQIREQRVDERCDVWALAVVAYRCLTGELPFDGDFFPLLDAILESEPPRASQLQPALPADLDEVLARALAKQRQERFENVQAFAGALASCLGFDDRATIPAPAPIQSSPASTTRPNIVIGTASDIGLSNTEKVDAGGMRSITDSSTATTAPIAAAATTDTTTVRAALDSTAPSLGDATTDAIIPARPAHGVPQTAPMARPPATSWPEEGDTSPTRDAFAFPGKANPHRSARKRSWGVPLMAAALALAATGAAAMLYGPAAAIGPPQLLEKQLSTALAPAHRDNRSPSATSQPQPVEAAAPAEGAGTDAPMDSARADTSSGPARAPGHDARATAAHTAARTPATATGSAASAAPSQSAPSPASKPVGDGLFTDPFVLPAPEKPEQTEPEADD